MISLKNFFEQALLFESNEIKRKLNIVTLFSGMGAPEIALDNLGIDYDILLASEYDAVAQDIYKKLHKDKLKNMIPNVYDILKRKGRSYLNKDILENAKKTKVDLLIAGFPCQAFSQSGKGFGFYSRKVNLVNKKVKPFVIHAKAHLENPNAGPGEETILKDSKKYPLSKRAKLNIGERVIVAPDSDGILSLKTLDIIEKLKPTVAILENVANFSIADFPTEEDLVTESLTNGNSELIKNQGKFMRELQTRFESAGYKFYPFILDPTSYVKGQIQRRPRTYMVAIKRQQAKKAERLFKGDINKIFGIDELYNKSSEEYNKAFDKGIDMIVHSKYSAESGYMTNDISSFVPLLITRIGKNKFINLSELLFNKVIELKNTGSNKNINELIETAFSSDKKYISYIKPSYASKIPYILDAKAENPVKFLEKLINHIKINGGFSSEITKKIFKNYIPFPKFDTEWDSSDESLQTIIEQTETEKYNLVEIETAIIEFIITKYLTEYAARPNHIKHIATIMKGHKFGTSTDKTAAADMFIVRSKNGIVKWGYLHPVLMMRFMGMMDKEDRDTFNSVENITDAKFNNNLYKKIEDKTGSINDIVARIGNSMSVSVLEKLFSSLINAGVFNIKKENNNDEDEEIMSSSSMFTPTSETGFSADTYAHSDNRLPNSLFKKPLKRKKLKESYYTNPEEAFSKGYISAYQLAKIKAEKEGRELTPEEEMFYADPENWDNKRPATEEEIKDFFTKIKLDLGIK